MFLHLSNTITGVMNAFFKEYGKIELETQLLQVSKIKSQKISEFSLISFVSMSMLCVALFVLRLLISFMNSSHST